MKGKAAGASGRSLGTSLGQGSGQIRGMRTRQELIIFQMGSARRVPRNHEGVIPNASLKWRDICPARWKADLSVTVLGDWFRPNSRAAWKILMRTSSLYGVIPKALAKRRMSLDTNASAPSRSHSARGY